MSGELLCFLAGAWLMIVFFTLIEVYQRRQRWRVVRTVGTAKYDEYGYVEFFVRKGGETLKVTRIGARRGTTSRPNTPLDEAMAEAVVQAREMASTMNATDQNLSRHG